MNRYTLAATWLLAVLCAALFGCQGATESNDNNGDGGTDTDTDVDTDTDADTDTDTGSDTNTDTSPVADNDEDGLSNGLEETIGTDPNNADTDGDGYSDLVEYVAGTNPTDETDNPGSHGDFYFVVPPDLPPEPTQDTLVFQTNIQMADVFFLMDTTGSMSGAISNLKSTLSSTIIPAIAAIIPFAWYGVGYHDDYPVGSYGSAGMDYAFQLLQPMTGDTALAQAGVNLLSSHYGGDTPESQVSALWAVATGGALSTYLPAQTSCDPGYYGYPCFRPGAIPIIITMTDSPFHDGPSNYSPYGTDLGFDPPTYTYAVAALDTIHAKVLPIYSGSAGDIGNTHAEDIALDTGAEIDGDPLVFPINYDGSGLDTSIVDAVNDLATAVPFDISTATRKNDADPVDATIFIDRIVPNEVGGVADPTDPTVFCVGGLPVLDTDGDSYAEIFNDITPGTSVCFDIYPKENTTVDATPEPQLYTAYIDVIGDSVTVLDTREVYFLIPPSSPIE